MSSWLTRLIFAILSIAQIVKAETCLSQAQLAGIVFGASLITLLLAILIAFVLWRFTRAKRKDESIIIVEQAPEKAAYENGALEMENKATEPMPRQLIDKMTSCHSLRQKNRLQNIQRLHSQRSRSSESLDKLKELKRLAAELHDMRPLGFNILQSDGYICVGGIQKNGPAEKSGNMFHGDRIKAINVSFDGILLEDAISLLSCAAPYKMKLELERTIVKHEMTNDEPEISQPAKSIQHQPFRSTSLTNLTEEDSSIDQIRNRSFMSKQKYALPRERRHSAAPSPTLTTPTESLRDSYPESSSPTASLCAQSSSTTLPISSMFDKELISGASSFDSGSSSSDRRSTSSTPPALPTSPPPSLPTVPPPSDDDEEMTLKIVTPPPAVPPKPKPPSPQKVSRLPIPKYSPKMVMKIEEVQRNGIDDFVEVSRFSFAKPTLTVNHAGGNAKVEFCERFEPKRNSVLAEFKENQNADKTRQLNGERNGELLKTIRQDKEFDSVTKPPRIVGMIVEKFEAEETPKIIERKLPPLPEMIDIPVVVLPEVKNGAALYLEKKDALRRTSIPPRTDGRDVTLAKEQRDRLDANRCLLERQQEELRALGIIP